MKRLRRIAIIATCLSAFSIFVISNTVLAKPPFAVRASLCFTFRLRIKIPASDVDVGGGPFLVFAISTLTAIAC